MSSRARSVTTCWWQFPFIQGKDCSALAELAAWRDPEPSREYSAEGLEGPRDGPYPKDASWGLAKSSFRESTHPRAAARDVSCRGSLSLPLGEGIVSGLGQGACGVSVVLQ